MQSIKSCTCGKCGKDNIKLLFVTNDLGTMETDIHLKIEDSYDGSCLIAGDHITSDMILAILQNSFTIDIMCDSCYDVCNFINVDYENGKFITYQNITGKELIREMIRDRITQDTGIWTLHDMYNFMDSLIEKEKQ